MTLRRSAVALLLLLAGAACERGAPRQADKQPQSSDTLQSRQDSAGVQMDADWRDENGPVLAISGDSAGTAILVLPALDTPRTSMDDVDSLRDLEVELFSTNGRVGNGRLRPRVSAQSDAEECAEWPVAQVISSKGTRAARWSVGFATGSATALAMDSLAGLHQPDSARLAAEIAKLASVMPNDTAPMFRGLPFRVQTAYRVHFGGSTIIIATVVRMINQEANARSEHLLLVAEQELNVPPSKLTLRYSERVSGPEESTETVDVLAVLLLGPERRPTVVLGRSDDSGTAFALVERSPSGTWTLQWSSPYTDC